MQYFDALNQPGIDEITGRIGKTANIKLVAEWYAVDQQSYPVPANPADCYAFCAKS